MVGEAIKLPTTDSEAPWVLNVDQLASGKEQRKGVLQLLKPHERTAPN